MHTDTEIANTVIETAHGRAEQVRKRSFSGSVISETQEVHFF